MYNIQILTTKKIDTPKPSRHLSAADRAEKIWSLGQERRFISSIRKKKEQNQPLSIDEQTYVNGLKDLSIKERALNLIDGYFEDVANGKRSLESAHEQIRETVSLIADLSSDKDESH